MSTYDAWAKLEWLKEIDFPLSQGRVAKIEETMLSISPSGKGYDVLVKIDDKYLYLTMSYDELMGSNKDLIKSIYDDILKAAGESEIFIKSKLHEVMYGE